MNIVFVSNYFNHHQNSVCDVLYRLTDGQFTFVATQEIPEMRKALGYKEITADYVIAVPPERYEQSIPSIDESDVLIAGSAPESMLKKHIRSGKLVFRYSERILKNGREPLKYLWRYIRGHYNNPSKGKIYMLCASAYTASDYAKFGLFKGKTYKWGYFPECKRYEDVDALIAQKDPQEILWCGRFLDWKHPDDVLTVAKRLKSENYRFHINMIGTGEMEDQLKQLIEENDLTEQITLPGPMPPEKVREYMERAGIYLFTSDHKEGWGAVLNEAMNSGCAVVASHIAGSTGFLLKNRENGLVYESGNTEMLYQKIKYLLDARNEQQRLGEAAYRTIIDEWNAEVATQRFMRLAECILNGEKYPDLYASGPCSRAKIVKDRWITE